MAGNLFRRTALVALCAAMLAAPVFSAALLGRYRAVSTSSAQAYTVYLTFDDGPSSVTERVLDILRVERIQATFFVVGATTERGVSLYNRILEEGHSLGLHTYTHDVGRIYASLDGYARDFSRLASWVYETTGTTPRVCRMVGGSNSSNCPTVLREQILSYLMEKGYACYDWDIDSLDSYGFAAPVVRLAENVIRAAKRKPDQDLVILLHDDAMRTTLPDALEKIIAYFKEQGYGFGALWEDTESVKRILPRKYPR